MRRGTHALLGIALGSLLALSSLAPAAAQPPTFVDVLIGFRGRPGPADEALVRQGGGSVKHRYTIIQAVAARVPSTALQGLRNNPNVAVAEPDVAVQAIHTADTSPVEVQNAWGVDRLDAEVVQAAGITGSGVRLAIVDSGSGPHPDLNVAERVSCIGRSPCQTGSGAGFDDDNGHGTHVAGSAAAIAGNNVPPYGGVVGVAPGATLISIKVLNASGGGSYSDIIAALDWLAAWSASNSGQIQVANFSLGSSGDPGVLTKQAFDRAYTSFNILSIAAAGNSGNRAGRGDNVIYPGRYDSVVAVGATDNRDARASFSSTGPAVELAAPGNNIWSTVRQNGTPGYGYMSGTSMATPHASGVAVLGISKTGPLTAKNSAVRVQLQASTKNLGVAGRDPEFGYGLVDPLKLTATSPGSLDQHNK